MSVPEVRVTGADQLERLGRRLKETGGKELRKEMLRGFREAGKPTIAHVRESALDTLPKRGGLAALIAGSKFGTRTRLSGNSVGMRIEGTSKHDIAAMNRGIVRHPVYDKGGWSVQSIRPAWFTKPIWEGLPLVQANMQRVMTDVAQKIERSV